jgi:ketosteroid isomerase-like protein
MHLRSTHYVLIFAALFSLEACLSNAAPPKLQCAPAANAQGEVVAVIKQMFVAAGADDLPALVAHTTPDFYAYDGGKRFTAQTLMELMKKAHAAGKHYEWNVTDPEVHMDCNFAWVTYVNRGSIEDAAGHQDMTWLESVILEYANGQWRTRFLHSTRVPSPDGHL